MGHVARPGTGSVSCILREVISLSLIAAELLSQLDEGSVLRNPN